MAREAASIGPVSLSTDQRRTRWSSLSGMNYVRLDRHAACPVEVQLDDGIWATGFLEAYRKVEGVWSGFVRYPSGRMRRTSGGSRKGAFRGTQLTEDEEAAWLARINRCLR